MKQGIVTDLSELEYLLTDPGFVSLDFETEGTHPKTSELVGFAVATQKGTGYVPLARTASSDDSELAGVPLSTGFRPAEVRATINRPQLHQVRDTPFLGWNVKFDLHAWRRLTGWRPAYAVDPMVGLWLLAEEVPLGLKATVETITGIEQPTYSDLKKRRIDELNRQQESLREQFVKENHVPRRAGMTKGDWTRKQDWEKIAARKFPTRTAKDVTTWDIDRNLLARYCIGDTLKALWLWFNVILPGLRTENLESYFYNYEMPFLVVLADMEWEGIELDTDMLASLGSELGVEIEQLQQQLNALAGWEVNTNSKPQVTRLLFEQEHLPLPSKFTKTGLPSTDADSLAELKEKCPDNPFVDLLLKKADLTKIKGTFCDGLPEGLVCGRLHTEFKQVGAVTGRLSSSEPNLQNIPKGRGLRRAFRAARGNVLIKADYSQAELRVLADRSRDPVLLETYRTGGDIHESTLSKLQLPDRRCAKVINFGTVYGFSERSYQYKLKWDYKVERSLDDCKNDLQTFYRIHGGILPWKNRLWAEGRRFGYVTTRLGRRRRLPFQSDDKQERAYAERQAANCVIQGDVADFMRVAMVRLNAQIYERYGARLLLQVHDELVIECPIVTAKRCAYFVKEVMESVFTLDVPIVADVEIGPTWGETVPFEKWEPLKEVA